MTNDKPQVREWDIWKPSNSHPHWEPDEQTYAIEVGHGHYNTEIYDLIDKAISKSAFDAVVKERDELKSRILKLEGK